MGMLIARNIEALLKQAIKPSSTSDQQTIAVTITQISGLPLCTVTSKECSITKINMYALLATREGMTTECQQYDVDSKHEEVYGALVPETQYGVVIVTEKFFPEGLVRIRLNKLTDKLKELAQLQEPEEDY